MTKSQPLTIPSSFKVLNASDKNATAETSNTFRIGKSKDPIIKQRLKSSGKRNSLKSWEMCLFAFFPRDEEIKSI